MSNDGVFEVGTSEQIHPTTSGMIMGEVLGSFILSFLGLGIGFTATLWSSPTSSYFAGIWPTAFGWAFAIGLGIFVSASLSGAHFNPAVTLALAVTKRHPWRLVPLYIVCQFVGWFIGALLLVLMFRPAMEAKAVELGVNFYSERIGSMLTTYAPNPGFVGTAGYDNFTFWSGFATETICTALLLLTILATGASLVNRPPEWAGALIIGFAIGLFIIFAAAVTQASFNPARDLAPRILLLMMGFGEYAFPGTGVYEWSVISTTIGPIVGGVAAALIFDAFTKVAFRRAPKGDAAQ